MPQAFPYFYVACNKEQLPSDAVQGSDANVCGIGSIPFAVSPNTISNAARSCILH